MTEKKNPNFANELTDFYRILSPIDSFIVNNSSVDGSVGATTLAAGKPADPNTVSEIKKLLIEGFKSGKNITERKETVNKAINKFPDGAEARFFKDVVKGLFNVAYQSFNSETTDYLYSQYFAIPNIQKSASATTSVKPANKQQKKSAEQKKTKAKKELAKAEKNLSNIKNKPNKNREKQQKAEEDAQKKIDKAKSDLETAQKELDSVTIAANPPPAIAPVDKPHILKFWQEICGENTNHPPVDFSIFMLRSQGLSRAVNNTGLIELYLTAMPPLFANQLVPYCDVEFQIPLLNQSTNNTSNEDYVQRPSLYRFLVGSGEKIKDLTEADKSLANVMPPSISDKRRFDREKKEDDSLKALKEQTFFGMEMFTTPQTLFDYNKLGSASPNDGPARLNDAKPFLPPATIKDVSIAIQNAGAGTYGKRNASIKMVVHDRKRLVEMAEFMRGADGYNRTTIYITYGMLAPRSRGSFDMYAKMINENMLSRNAFCVTNTQFSLNVDGSIDVTLTCADKGSSHIEQAPISFGPIDKKKRELRLMIADLKKNINALDYERDEKKGFSKSEIRVAQLVSAAAAGNLVISLEDAKTLKNDIKETKKLIKGALPRGNNFDKDKVEKLIEEFEKLFDQIYTAESTRAEPPPKGGKGGSTATSSLTSKLRKEGKGYASQKMNALAEGKDPFLPGAYKNNSSFHSSANAPFKKVVSEVLNDDGEIRYFHDDLLKVVDINKDNGNVSFGRIFSSFCMPAILNSVADEFGWSSEDANKTDNKCPIEVQVVYYQLNKYCGPVSRHNVAEFPVDRNMFVEKFGQFIQASGGDNITLGDFFGFLNDEIIGDVRQPGYGRQKFYKPFSAPEPSEPKKEDKNFSEAAEPIDRGKPEETEKTFNDNLEKWSKRYGSEFVVPRLTIEFEASTENASTKKSGDLLAQLGNRVGAGYNTPVYPKEPNEKTIIKIHIYDRTSSPHEELTAPLRLADDGTYYLFANEEKANNEKTLEYLKSPPSTHIPAGLEVAGNSIKENGQTIALNIGKGRDALMNYLGERVPKITVGTEGSLITNIQLSSKTSGLEGTIAMQGGTQRRESSITSTGLSQEQYSLPMILYPAELSMNTVGCTLGAMQQQFFVDFGTNTTLDNCYTVTKITHNFTPGKFETSWGLCYTDGYGRMISGNELTGENNVINQLKATLAEAEAARAKDLGFLEAPTPPPSPKKSSKPGGKTGAPATASGTKSKLGTGKPVK